MNNEKESFEEWFERSFKECSSAYKLSCYSPVFKAWNHQQKKIDQLETKLKTENVSHNYHCKESQRKNDVIDQLEKTIEKHVFELDVLGGDLLLGGHQMIAKRFKALRKKLLEKV